VSCSVAWVKTKDGGDEARIQPASVPARDLDVVEQEGKEREHTCIAFHPSAVGCPGFVPPSAGRLNDHQTPLPPASTSAYLKGPHPREGHSCVFTKESDTPWVGNRRPTASGY